MALEHATTPEEAWTWALQAQVEYAAAYIAFQQNKRSWEERGGQCAYTYTHNGFAEERRLEELSADAKVRMDTYLTLALRTQLRELGITLP